MENKTIYPSFLILPFFQCLIFIMLGLEKGKLKFVPHNPEWKRLFESEKKILQTAIGKDILDIQHIGSTSIPGIIAKPILDIAIAVTNFEAAAVCIQPIENLGYIYMGEYGLPRRHLFTKGDLIRTHNIHMWEIHSQDWQRHILFRDYLIKYPEFARQYSELKLKLLEEHQGDRDKYQDGKSLFIDRIEQLARSENKNYET
ncbi:MAG: GrpB family protein [Prochloraceae cyanobacterium]|nr:GrpB family protein [Prochloraceae cyanobacterium]